MNNLLDKEHAN